MTFLEKVKQLKPNLIELVIIPTCPQRYGLEKESICPEDKDCVYCWNREIPKEIEKEEA